MAASWAALPFFLLLTTAAASAAPSIQTTTPPAPRQAEVVVIDVTKNTSSIVTIDIAPRQPQQQPNATAEDMALTSALSCLAGQKANLFLLVHLNRNWRQKLSVVDRVLRAVYAGGANAAVVFFNAFTRVLATFGTDPATNEAELMMALAQVQAGMLKDETAAVSEHWLHFQLDDALKVAYRYAHLFLHQFSLDVRPSVLVTYFDDSAGIGDGIVADVADTLHRMAPRGPFKASVSLLQWPQDLPVPAQWARLSELVASAPEFQISAATEGGLLKLLGQLAPALCNRTATVTGRPDL